MKFLYRIFIMFALGQVYAPSICSEEMDVASVISGMNIQKSEVAGMLDKLVADGMIKKEDADKAKAELTGMDQKKFESLTDTAKDQYIKADGDAKKLPQLPDNP